MEFSLTERWAAKPTKNLKVSGSFEIFAANFLLKFNILEPSVLAENKEFNSPVWQDSCVEFFCSFGNNNYYNFEINAVGAVLAQFGKNRNNRAFLNIDVLKKITVKSSLGSEPFGLKNELTEWNIEIVLPFSIFSSYDRNSLNLLSFNIYKCADRSPHKHYMSLFDIDTEKPDFHRPEFFKKLK